MNEMLVFLVFGIILVMTFFILHIKFKKKIYLALCQNILQREF
jgi:hypothetical protein